MNRHFVAICGAIALVAPLMLSARAPQYSAWSTPENLGAVINTSAGEDHPAISKDGLSLYFQSSRPGGFGGIDLYVAHRARKDRPWGPPVNLGPVINTASSEVVPALSRDGHYLFFVSPRAGSADIFVSYRRRVHDNAAWEAPQMLGPEVNSAFTDTSPSFFENDDYGLPQLFFNSNRPGGPGLSDIYMTEMRAEGWLMPSRLVPELSSPENDLAPDIFRNGLEIFFQSDRPGGVGGNDLWTSDRASVMDPWSAPQNLGGVVNSESSDGGPSISSDGLTLFFASTRSGGMGGVDLYMTTRTRR